MTELTIKDNLPSFYGHACPIHEKKCNIWMMYEYDSQSSYAISSKVDNARTHYDAAPRNINDVSYIVPVIEVPKELINDK